MKILLVEDDIFYQKFYSTKLAEKGFEIFVASDGEQGLQMIEEVKPNIILLDIIMPKKDGFEVLEALGKNGTLKTTPVLVFSSLGGEQDVQKALKLGAVGFVNKSFYDIDSLLTKISSIAQT